VCGGLGRQTPVNAWAWRLFFIALTLATLGTGALMYLVLWWVLPLDSPVRPVASGWRGLVGFLLSIVLLIGFLLRAQLADVGGFWLQASVLLALIFALKQVFAGKRGQLALGIVLLALPLVGLLGNLDILTGGIYDVLLRAYPALLIFIGLAIALRYRVPLGGMIALALSISLTAGVVYYAYTSRIDTQLTSNQVTIAETIAPQITTLQVNLTTLDTDVRVAVQDDTARTISGTFTGGDNSDLRVGYEEDGAIATLTIAETEVSDFPLLEAVGRADFTLALPPDVAVAVAYQGVRGTVDFDMANLALERLNLTHNSGNVLVTLPDYQPLSRTVIDNPGQWLVLDGNLDVRVPPDVGGRFFLERGSNAEPRPPQNYDDLIYAVELSPNDYILASRRYDVLDVQVRYRVNVPNGRFRIITERDET